MRRPPARQSGRRIRGFGPAVGAAILAACWMTHAGHAGTAAPVGARPIPTARPGVPAAAPHLTAEGRELASLREQALRQLLALEERLRAERDAEARRQLQIQAAEIKRTYWIRAMEVMLAGARRAGNGARAAQLEALLRGVTSPRAPATARSPARSKHPDP